MSPSRAARTVGRLLKGTRMYTPARFVYRRCQVTYARLYRRWYDWRTRVGDPPGHRVDGHASADEYGRVSFNEYVPAEDGPPSSVAERMTRALAESPERVGLFPHPSVSNPVLSPDDVPGVLASYVADPFVVREGETFHMFFEIKDRAGDAFIAHATSENGVDYVYDRVVIPPSQAQHSYPMVFRHRGAWYMTPSSVGELSGQFRIYRARNFPYDWELVDVPLTDRVRIDPTPFRFDGTWYLLFQESETFDVVLWYADALLGGEWQEHPASPIFSPRDDHPAYADRDLVDMPWGDPRSPGELPIVENVPSGRPIVGRDHVDVFYRCTVEGTLHHYRITELSPERFDHYELPDSPVLSGTGRDEWNGHMMHTVNPLFSRWQGRDVVLVDGLEPDEYVWHIGVYTLDEIDDQCGE